MNLFCNYTDLCICRNNYLHNFVVARFFKGKPVDFDVRKYLVLKY